MYSRFQERQLGCGNLLAAERFEAAWENVRAGHGAMLSAGMMDNSVRDEARHLDSYPEPGPGTQAISPRLTVTALSLPPFTDKAD